MKTTIAAILLFASCKTVPRAPEPRFARAWEGRISVRFIGLEPAESDLWTCGFSEGGYFDCYPRSEFEKRLAGSR